MGKSQVPRGTQNKDKKYRRSDFSLEKNRDGTILDKSKGSMKFNKPTKKKK